MKRFGQYSVWILAFLFVVGIIVVYKTFDNLAQITVFFGKLGSILMPFVLGFIIAYILNMPCKSLEKQFEKSKVQFIRSHGKPISIVIVYAAMIAILLIAIRAVVPAIYKNIMDMYLHLPDYINSGMEFLQKFHLDERLSFLRIDENVVLEKIYAWFATIDFSKFSKYAQGVINVTSGVLNIFIAFVISVYMLIDKERLKKGIYRVCSIILGKNVRDGLISYVQKLNDIFSKYLYSQLLDALVVATLGTVLMSILKVKYAILLGILVGLFNLIPYFGAIIGIVGTILITCFTGGIGKAIWTAVTLIVMQQVDANIIGPKIMGRSLEIRPLWVIFAVTVGGGFFGVPGMILSVPVFAMIRLILGDILRVKEERQGSIHSSEPEDGEE